MPANAGAKPLPISASIKAERAAHAAEVKRLAAIKNIAAKYGDLETTINGKSVNIQAHAIEHGWDANKTELEAMRAERQQASPRVIVRPSKVRAGRPGSRARHGKGGGAMRQDQFEKLQANYGFGIIDGDRAPDEINAELQQMTEQVLAEK